MNNAHAPGPWHFVEDTDRRWLQGSDGSTIYHLDDFGNKLPNEANARLIAAAPELLAALRFILAFYEPGQRHLDTEAWKIAEAQGRYALAKADGGPSSKL